MWKNTIAIHNILKKKNYDAKFLTNSIFKKVTSTKIILEKKKKQKKIKKRESWEKK